MRTTRWLLGLLLVAAPACAYLGAHGPTIRSYPDVHKGAAEDTQCRECHAGTAPEGPVSPHPGFHGCLKCHNDAPKPEKK